MLLKKIVDKIISETDYKMTVNVSDLIEKHRESMERDVKRVLFNHIKDGMKIYFEKHQDEIKQVAVELAEEFIKDLLKNEV